MTEFIIGIVFGGLFVFGIMMISKSVMEEHQSDCKKIAEYITIIKAVCDRIDKGEDAVIPGTVHTCIKDRVFDIKIERQEVRFKDSCVPRYYFYDIYINGSVDARFHKLHTNDASDYYTLDCMHSGRRDEIMLILKEGAKAAANRELAKKVYDNLHESYFN